jgi:hypothetical protein
VLAFNPVPLVALPAVGRPGIVITAFATLGVGAFDYDALAEVPVEAWAAAVTSLQVVLLVLLSTWPRARATTRTGGRDTPRSHGRG